MNVLDGFSAVFWAKLCQRTGGWAIPAPVPSKDADGTPFTSATHAKASGLREETSADRTARVAGIMRVYFSLLLLPPSAPLSREFHMPRLWIFVARLIGQPALLQSPLATELLSGTRFCNYGIVLADQLTEDIQLLWRLAVLTPAAYGARSGSSLWPCCMRASQRILLLLVARGWKPGHRVCDCNWRLNE